MIDMLLSNINSSFAKILEKPFLGEEINQDEAILLFEAEDSQLMALIAAANELRKITVGDEVTFVINRNINFTNYCSNSCAFCAFRKEPNSGEGYLLRVDQLVDKAKEAYAMGATEVCIQGGLNPDVTSDYYLNVCAAIKASLPPIHIHAFSPQEIFFAAQKRGSSIEDYLAELKSAGLDSMPGTAAEILDDEVRRIICPGKINAQTWISIIKAAHKTGIPTSATMMYGHVENIQQRAYHLHVLRQAQRETGGFTEFVPLGFVYKNTPLNKTGRYTFNVTSMMDIKIHAIARLMLNNFIRNIQVSWLKMGDKMAQFCLQAGCNDFGGTLMEENITSSASGDKSRTSMKAAKIMQLISASKRVPVQRSTTYNEIKVWHNNGR